MTRLRCKFDIATNVHRVERYMRKSNLELQRKEGDWQHYPRDISKEMYTMLAHRALEWLPRLQDSLNNTIWFHLLNDDSSDERSPVVHWSFMEECCQSADLLQPERSKIWRADARMRASLYSSAHSAGPKSHRADCCPWHTTDCAIMCMCPVFFPSLINTAFID